jgi:hypothetical protein
LDNDIVSPNHFGILPRFYWFNQYGVAVNFDQDHDVFVAALGLRGELAGLIGEGHLAHVVPANVNVLDLFSAQCFRRVAFLEQFLVEHTFLRCWFMCLLGVSSILG